MDLFTLALRIKSIGLGDAKKWLADLDAQGKRTAQTFDAQTAAQKKQEQQLRILVERWHTFGDASRNSYTQMLKNTGQWERFGQIQQQVAAEMAEVDRVSNALAASQSKVSSTASASTTGVNRLRGSFQTLAAQLAGTNPAVTTLAGSLGSFAVGAGLTLGILAGVAAIGLAFKGAIQTWNDAEKASDDLIDSLSRQGRAMSDAGADAAQAALKFAKANLARVQASQAGAGSQISGLLGGLGTAIGGQSFGGFIMTGEATKNALELQRALDAVRAAEQAVGDAEIDRIKRAFQSWSDSWDLEKAVLAERKKNDEEAKRAAEEANRKIDERIELLTKAMSIDDVRATATTQLQRMEASLSRVIEAGNLPLQRRVELEERLARVRAGLATPGLSPLATEPTVSITPQNEGGAFPSGPMPNVPANRVKDLPPLINASGKVAVDAMTKLQADMQSAIGNLSQVLGDGIYDAFAAAFNGEGIGGVFKAFGKTVLAGIGQIFSMMGQAYLQYGVIMSGLVPTLSNPFTAGPTAIAIGALLVALGGALGAISKGGGRGTAASNYRAPQNGTNDVIRLKFVDRPNQPAVGPVQPVVINAYGPNDPRTQRWMLETFNNANRRKG